MKPPVAVAFSGGKDSSAAVLFLREAGHSVRALHLRLGLAAEDGHIQRVVRLAETLAVPLEIIDARVPFKKTVIEYFLAAYRSGRTPNPCAVCNRHFKFGFLLRQLKGEAGELLATGHYAAQVEITGQRFLREPRQKTKSQIYFLSLIDPAVLERVLFPLADRTLADVRRRVARLPLANPEESQDACFLQGQSLAEYLGERLPASFRPGDFLSGDGQIIGRHQGALHYTVGQRRGTRFSSSTRLYVLGVDVAANTVTLGSDRKLYADSLRVRQVNFWRPLRPGDHLKVKIRSQHRGEMAAITAVSESGIEADFAKPVRALTPGQVAVFYDDDIIVAAGEIA